MTVPLQIKPAIPSITGIKRKITANGVNGFASCSTKKKPRKEWSCALCKVSATREKDLDSHLQGRKHKARELGLMRAKGAISLEIEGSGVLKHSDELDLANASSSSVLGDEGKKIPVEKMNDIESVQKDEAANENTQNDHLQGEEDDDEAELNMKGVENKDIERSITFAEKPKIDSRCNPIGGKVHIEGSITLPEKPEGSKINSRCNPVGGKMPAKAMKSENCGEAILQKNQNPEDVRKFFKFWCEHCQIGCGSAINLAVHETGKKHMGQIRTLKQDNEDVKLDVRKNVKAVAKQKAEDFKEKFKYYWCEQCQVGYRTAKMLVHHKKGKKHMARLRVAKKDVHRKRRQQETEDFKEKFKYWCEQCQVGCKTEKMLVSHAINMSVHQTGKKHMAQIRTLKQDNEDVKLDVKYWCKQCQVGCETEKMWVSHEKGKKHMARLLRKCWSVMRNRKRRQTTTLMVGWSPPDQSWLKINTDGAARGHPGIAGAGFICRNSETTFIMGLAQPLGVTTDIIAETWSLLLATRTATERQWMKVIFETDSENLMRFVTSRTTPPWYLQRMIAEIKHHINNIPYAEIQHNYREGNQAADALANHAADGSQIGNFETKIWEQTIPSFINHIVLSDSLGTKYPRVISS